MQQGDARIPQSFIVRAPGDELHAELARRLAAHKRGCGLPVPSIVELDDDPPAPHILPDSKALDLIAKELSEYPDWSPDTLNVIAAYVRGTGREVSDV
jgi:hypothetical protein